jgi:hypothetical protein
MWCIAHTGHGCREFVVEYFLVGVKGLFGIAIKVEIDRYVGHGFV